MKELNFMRVIIMGWFHEICGMNSKNRKSISMADGKNSHQMMYFGRFYLSQGRKQNGESTNDCGPACVAMIFNLIKDRAGGAGKKITGKDVIGKTPLCGRLPGWLPKVGGATAPWGLVNAFNHLARQYQFPWKAVRVSHATDVQIIEILNRGGYISFLRFWDGGGAHWTNIVGLTSTAKHLVLLDPNPLINSKKISARALQAFFSDIRDDWERQPWWAACLGLKNEIIVYSAL